VDNGTIEQLDIMLITQFGDEADRQFGVMAGAEQYHSQEAVDAIGI